MFKHELEKAREHFYQASMMLTFSVDCFDRSLVPFMNGQENSHLLTVSELFAYLGRVNSKASPFGGWNHSGHASLVPQSPWPPAFGMQRLLTPTLLQSAAVLPPLCFVNGSLHLRVEGLKDRKLDLFDFTGGWKLLPVHPLKSLLPVGISSTAVLLFVDSPAWLTLGHTIYHLTAVTHVTLGLALKHGGVEEMLRLRKRLQFYIFFPPLELRDSGYEALAPWGPSCHVAGGHC
eukprot:symbB.v1.2.008768.t1/scaffold549.1/size255684/9